MIKRFLKWLLAKIEHKERVDAWPFPPMSDDFDPRPVEKPKRKPCVAKATTRPKKPVAKKATTVAKKTTKKAK